MNDNTETLPWTPTEANRCGRQLSAGQMEITLTSRETGKHLTLRFMTKTNIDGRWKRVPFAQGVCFVNYEGRRIATIVQRNGKSHVRYFTTNEALRWSIAYTLRYVAGTFEEDAGAARIQTTDQCGHCYHKLTDPESIDRGIGPECFGKHTNSKHAQVAA